MTGFRAVASRRARRDSTHNHSHSPLQAAESSDAAARLPHVSPEDPLGLLRALEASDRFKRDTPLGGIFHHGKISFREVRRTDSLHIIIDGTRVSAHVDRISPLSVNPANQNHYSWPRVLAHNAAGIVADVFLRATGRSGHHRCQLECEVVWVDDDLPGSDVDECHPGGGPDEAPAGDDPTLVIDAQAPGSATVPERVPFSLVDEAVHLLDTEAAPWSIQLELRVTGHFDEDRLRSAVDEALRRHPMARARKAASRRSAHHDDWEIPPSAELDPLRVRNCPDDEALTATRAQLQSRGVPLAESPPVRMVLARHPEGDILMCNFNHAATDGFGAMRILQSVARAYAGEEDPAPVLDFLEARTLPVRLAEAGTPTRVRRYLAVAEKLRDFLVPPARMATDGGRDVPGYGFHQVVVPAEQTAALTSLRRRGTVNDALLTALHLAIAAWNAEHGRPCKRIGVLVPSNLRPPQWRDDMVGNFSLPARIGTSRRNRRTPGGALAAVSAQTRRKKRSGMGTAMIQLLGRSPLLPLWAKQAIVDLLPLTGNRLVDTAMLSNLGRFEGNALPSFGAAGQAVEVWFSAPARMPLGLSIGSVTVDGRLHLSFRYRHRLLAPAAAERFADCYLHQVARLVGQRP